MPSAGPSADATVHRSTGHRSSDHRSTAGAFVGRVLELDRLVAALRSAPGPDGPVQLISGLAGIGKTRLATELAAVAASEGARVVWGHCWDEAGAPPYWPWTQVVRELLGRTTGSDLARLVLDDPDEAERFELFDGVAAVVRTALEAGPVVVVLDDLHDADDPSLHLTRFVARHLHHEPLLIVATHRPVDPADRPELAEHVAALARLGGAHHLGGLDVEEVRALLDDPRVAEQVHAITAGNPLHVGEVVRSGRRIGRSPAAVGEPGRRDLDGLRGAVRARVDALDDEERRVVEAAAVLGPRFLHAEVADLADVDPLQRVLAKLEVAGLVVTPRPGHGELTHPLIAEVTLAAMPTERRHALHGRAAARSAGDEDRIGEHAHHLLAAGPTARRAALAACRRGAEAATRALAHEDAATLHRRALDAIGDDPAFRAERLDLLLRLGDMHWRAARPDLAEPAYEEAWSLAVRLGDPASLGRASRRSGVQYYFTAGAPSPWEERTRTALDAQPPGDSDLRSLLVADLATHHALPGRTAVGARLAAEALAMARRSGDPLAVGTALVAEQVTALGPSTLHRRLESAREILANARDAGDYRLKVHGRFLLMGALLELGDTRALDAELLAQHQMVDDLGEPRLARFVQWFRGTRALFDGDVDAAEEIAEQCYAVSRRVQDPDALSVYGGQLGVTRWVQGRIMEVEPLFVAMRADDPTEPLWSATLAWIWADQGHLDAARGALDGLPDPATIPEGMHWLLTMTAAAEAAATVGTLEQVAALRTQLEPYRDRVVPVAMGAATWGTVAKPLGRLALRLGRIDEGIAHLEAAIATCARLGARPWLLDAQIDLAGVLLEHRPGDPRIAALAAEASDAAEHLGLAMFAERVAALDLGAPRTGTAPTAGRSPRPRIRVLGDFEVVAADGTTARWTSRKARQLLKVLVARRGAPIAREELMDLLWPDEDPAVLGNRLSVALSTVRRSLDPERRYGLDELVVGTQGEVRLHLDVVDVDLERFLAEASRLRGADDRFDLAAGAALLAAHRGEAFIAEPHADWAAPVRSEVRSSYVDLARRAAEAATDAGDHGLAVDAHRAILDVDPYDEPAHLGRVAALRASGAHGRADEAQLTYEERMAELGVPFRRSRSWPDARRGPGS